jgi:maltose alpha-D-glucosyltransferase/alpha-amylase
MTIKATSDLWWKNAVVYCLDVETFLDSNGDGCGDLAGVTDRLDYLAGLGVTCLWLMPFYPSSQRDDGYDITDFYGIDGRLGTPGDFAEMIRTAADRGIRVIADLVVNHTSNRHPWFQSGRDRESPFHDFYVWADEKPAEKPGDVVFPDREKSNWAYDRKARQWYLHRFYSHQPDLNIASRAVQDEIAQVVGYWLVQGLAGFRVDAVPFLIEPVGLPEGTVPDPHDFLRDLRRFIGRRRGDAILMGEVNLPPDQQRAFFGDEDGDELHMILNFVVNQAMYLALARGDAGPMWRALESLANIPADCQWANFVRNHDELTLDKLSDEERAEVFAALGPDPELQLYGRGLRRRLPTMVAGDERRMRMLYSLAFSLPGTPVLFYGEEIGMAENLEIAGRYSVRAPMQWSSERNGGFSVVEDPGMLCRPAVDAEGWSPARVNVAAQRRSDGSLLNWMERLIRRRRECPELGWGPCKLLDAGPGAVLAHRADWEGGTILALHSFAEERLEARVRLEPGIEEVVDLLEEGSLVPDAEGAVTVPLEPYGYGWFRVRRDGQRVAP